LRYRPFPRRWNSKWSSEWKSKSSMVITGLFSNVSFEKRPDHQGFRFAFRWPFRVSSSRERAVKSWNHSWLFLFQCTVNGKHIIKSWVSGKSDVENWHIYIINPQVHSYKKWTHHEVGEVLLSAMHTVYICVSEFMCLRRAGNCIFVYINICKCVYICVYVYLCMCMYVYIFICIRGPWNYEILSLFYTNGIYMCMCVHMIEKCWSMYVCICTYL